MKPEDLVPRGCCGCGCGRPTKLHPTSSPAWGRVKGQPRRFLAKHGAHGIGVLDRIAVSDDGCWIWTGKWDAHGYGRLTRDGRSWLAHRWIYERLVEPLPRGLVIDHLCRNHACVNPEHLEPVMDAINTRRGRSARLTEAEVEQLRVAYAVRSGTQRAFCIAEGERLGMSPKHLEHIVAGRFWKSPKPRRQAGVVQGAAGFSRASEATSPPTVPGLPGRALQSNSRTTSEERLFEPPSEPHWKAA